MINIVIPTTAKCIVWYDCYYNKKAVIWSHSADMLSARQYLNQPKDDAIIFSGPPSTRFGSLIFPNTRLSKLVPASCRYKIWVQYGPVTMIVPVSGHQVRCIPWVQMGTFYKEIGFYVDWTSLHWIYFVGNTYNRVYISDVANMVKTATVKDVPINNDALLNIQAC